MRHRAAALPVGTRRPGLKGTARRGSAEWRLRLLAEAGDLLSSSLDCVAAVISVARLALGTFADWTALDATDELGQIRRLAVEHVDPARAHAVIEMRQYPPGPSSPVWEALRSRRAVAFTSSDIELHGRYHDPRVEHLTSALGIAHAATVPLLARGKALGTLTFVRADPRRTFVREDLALATELAKRAALAIDNARLYEAERRAREDQLRARVAAERAAGRIERLQDVTARLSEAVTPADVARVIVEQGSAAVGAERGALWLIDARDGALTLAYARGIAPEALADWGRISLDAALPVAEALRTGAPVIVARAEDGMRRFPELVRLPAEWRPHAVAVFPLFVKNAPAAALGLDFGPGHRLWAADRPFIEAIVRQGSLALDRSRLYADLEAAVRAREDFLSLAGHELRTPLTALELNVYAVRRLLREGAPAARIGERAQQATQNLERLERLVGELLEVSRIRAGRLALDRAEMDLAAVMAELLAREGEQLARAGCEVSFAAPGPVVGCWDRLWIEQIASNLLSNAIQHGRGRPIAVRVEAADGVARLVVADQGVGIAAGDHARIFDRFEGGARVRHSGGLGLGLWMARQVVEAHGGTIRATSERREGAIFTVELPIHQPEVRT